MFVNSNNFDIIKLAVVVFPDPDKPTKYNTSPWLFIDLNDFALRYLNPYVKSFSVKELIDELEDNNLYFQGWYNNNC